MRDYRKIDAWKLADDLTVIIYERTRKFPTSPFASAWLSYRCRTRVSGRKVKAVFACLHGLIKAVEKESGKVARAVAATTSALVLCLARLLPIVAVGA